MRLFPQGKIYSLRFSISEPSGTNPTKRKFKYCRLSIVIMLLFLGNVVTNAQPTYVGMSASHTDNAVGAGPTATLATASIGTMNMGDLVVVYAQYRGTGVTLSIGNTGGQAWATATAPTGANSQTYAVFWCRYNGAWTGGNPTVTNTTGTNGLTAIMYVYRPTVGTKAWNLNAGPSAITTTSNTTVAIGLPSLTPTVNNSVTMGFWFSAVSNTWGSLTAGWTKPGTTQYRNTTNAQSVTGAYKILGTAAATGTVSQSRNTGTQISNGVVLTWAEGNAVSNDLCLNAPTLTVGSTCTTTSGTLDYSTFTSDGGPSGCSSNAPDVWYKFVATGYSQRITNALVSGTGQRRTEAFSGSCGTLVSIGCSGNNDNLDLHGLVIGQPYYIRVYSQNNSPYAFNLCVQRVATANGTCATSTVLTPGTSCTPTTGSLYLADQTADITGACGNTYWDVWYTFTAPSGYDYATISLTPTGSGNVLTSANTLIEVFKSSGCLPNNNSWGCTSIGLPRPISITSGTQYRFRVYHTANPNVAASNYNFNVCVTLSNTVESRGGRTNEIFKQQILSDIDVLDDPWEVYYDTTSNKLWITESKGYKVYTMNPDGTGKTTALDISFNSTFLPSGDRALYNAQFNIKTNGAQGGLAGLTIHPNFGKGTNQDFVYISYIYKTGSPDNSITTTTYAGNSNPCKWFTNKLVRFTYNSGTGTLGTPVAVCDTLPGGNDHNSQRLTIAKIGGTNYLFYGSGDLGAGQLDCYGRFQRAQIPQSYEGKILRFNLDPVGPETSLSSWIPVDNPYNGYQGIVSSAVWVTGIRNNQGFAFDPETGLLYGSSHGPYSDDEINIIEKGYNYGHPMVIGYVSDGNYNSADTTSMNNRISAGAPYLTNNGFSANHTIFSESARRDSINKYAIGELGKYKDPLFSAYPSLPAGPNYKSIKDIWQTNPNYGGWPSEGWSGLDLYTNSMIPGWRKSLIASSLKWGRLLRLKLGANGRITMPSNNAVNNAGDTISLFGGTNRYRDIAFGPNGRDIFVIMDKSQSTSGPSAQWPMAVACNGCLLKYTFLGYWADPSTNKSYIPNTVGVAQGTNDACQQVNKVTINAANSNMDYWVPITDQNSDIVAEIYAMGQTLDTVRTTVYHNTTGVRSKSGKKYLDRNITITPDVQPLGDVRIRLYITEQELTNLIGSSGSGITQISDLKIVKNNDVCGGAMTNNTTPVTMEYAETFKSGESYVLQGTISSFSSFYFGSAAMATLPLELLSFTGNLQNNNTLLQWETAQEVNTSHFVVERSLDASTYTNIGTVSASGNINHANYSYTDYDAGSLPVTTIYYRLKMVDRDGVYTYSKIVRVSLPYVAGKVVLTPNPVVDMANVMITTATSGKANWKIIDNTGRIVMRGVTTLQPGNNQIQFSMGRQPAGIYFLDVSGGGVSYQLKIQKL